MTTISHDIVVIGGGPAGMAAAVAAFDAGVRDVVILERESGLGGVLRQCIHSGFGLHKVGRELTGPEYAQIYRRKVLRRNILFFCNAAVVAVSKDRAVTVQCQQGILKIQAKALILAMGCRERSRGALNIAGTRPAGIYTAGTAQRLINCDGYMVGKRAVILGSGDIGLIMARRMTLEGAKVEAVCEVLPYSGGLIRNIVQCLQDFNIPLMLNTTVCQIHGRNRIEGVTIARVDEERRIIEKTKQLISCDTLLLSVGLIPENELTRAAGIPIDPVTKGAIVDENCQTQAYGIFACGNVLHVHDLVDYVSDEAEKAGISAAALVQGEALKGDFVATKAGAGVRYVLPQLVHKDTEQETTLFFRAAKPFAKVRCTISSGGKAIAAKNSPRAVPGEMEKVVIPQGALKGVLEPVIVGLEELL